MNSTKTTVKPPSLIQLSKKLKSIGKIEKCEGCGCYIDTINEVDAVLKKTSTNSPDDVAAREIIDELSAQHKTTHGCIGCDPCYPVAISNALFALSDGESVAGLEPSLAPDESCGSGCGCEAPARAASPSPVSLQLQPAFASWPLETGDYRLGNLSGCVAISTLASENLYKSFSEKVCEENCAICGKVFTENIGIEKVVKNIISNRHIRFLILCGQEAKGHLTGACFKSLYANGITDKGKIIAAPGKRPWVKTLTAAQIARFQAQVELIDLIGCEDVTIIEETALALAERNPGAMKEDVQLAGVPRYVASNKVTLRLDKAGFLIIHPKPESGLLLVEHYKNSGEPTCMIEGSDSAIVCAELIERGLVSQLDHAAYLGRELERAKLAMQLGFPFVQDRALGELDPSTMPEW
jgi:tetrahydromethanopterin S-methyltransferase subunit A